MKAAADAAAKTIYPGLAPAMINRQIYTPLSVVISKAAEKGRTRSCPEVRGTVVRRMRRVAG
jgi:hypothetical protein